MSGKARVYIVMEKQITSDEIIKKLKEGEFESPSELSNYVVILSASLYTAGNFELDAEIEYMKKWEAIKLSGEMTDKMAEAKAKQTEEYKLYKQAQIANKTIQQTIMALKKKLTNLQFEYSSGVSY